MKYIILFGLIFLIVFFSLCNGLNNEVEANTKTEKCSDFSKYISKNVSGVECEHLTKDSLTCTFFDEDLYYYDKMIGLSMWPTLADKSITIKKWLKNREFDFELNAIYTYDVDDKYITHRCVQILEDEKGEFCMMKGDANELPDTVVFGEKGKAYKEDIISKTIWEVRRVG